jgi:drug/metabolite transporter (DMT)-like permease
MAIVSSLRETSVIFAALIGTLLLGEPFGRQRVIAALLVALGIIIMRVWQSKHALSLNRSGPLSTTDSSVWVCAPSCRNQHG